ncbi:MAG: class I SAM-dependent methyltransferase [Wenzhouxiangella sp.]|nr:class I SAM-dependent methyltransferase [Wenzhouxiangella sp.]
MSTDWYLEDDFWRNFGSLMFSEDSFREAAEQLPGLLRLAGMEPGMEPGRVLDLGCGPGRHALPLAASGYPVTAVDTSPSLLDHLEQACGELPIEIVKADMREFLRPEAFDLVLVMWTSFGYFEDEADHRKVLTNIRASLRPGGRLVLDLVGLEYLCRNLEPAHLTEYDDGRLLLERPMLVDDMSRLDNEWLLIDGDQVSRQHFSHRVWSAGEIRGLLEQCGFEIHGLYGSYAGGDYDLDAERLIVIAGGRHLKD